MRSFSVVRFSNQQPRNVWDYPAEWKPRIREGVVGQPLVRAPLYLTPKSRGPLSTTQQVYAIQRTTEGSHFPQFPRKGRTRRGSQRKHGVWQAQVSGGAQCSFWGHFRCGPRLSGWKYVVFVDITRNEERWAQMRSQTSAINSPEAAMKAQQSAKATAAGPKPAGAV